MKRLKLLGAIIAVALCMCCVPALALASTGPGVPNALPEGAVAVTDASTNVTYVYQTNAGSEEEPSCALRYIHIIDMYDEATELDIPGTVSLDGVDYPVTEIGYTARDYGRATPSSNNTNIFGDSAVQESAIPSYQKRITKIVIPATVEKLNDSCFRNCTNLKSVIFEEGSKLKEMGYACFMWCSSLSDITIPEGFTTFTTKSNGRQFDGCNLKKFVIPSSVTAIPTYLFGYDVNRPATSLEELIIGEDSKITTLPMNLLQYTSIVSLNLPKSFNTLDRGIPDTTKTVILNYSKDSNNAEDKGTFTIKDFALNANEGTEALIFTGSFDELSISSKALGTVTPYAPSSLTKFIFTSDNIKNITMPDKSAFQNMISAKIDFAFYGVDAPYSDAEGAENAALPTWCHENGFKYIQLSQFTAQIEEPSIYTGKAVTANLKVTGSGRTLEEGVDYETVYTDNVELGTATVTIKGLPGEFYGYEQTLNFPILTDSGKTYRTQELAGESRYDTALAEAVAAYPEGCSRLIVASGENFPDALAATALAGLMNCPVMITSSAAMSDQVRTAILTLGVDDVVIVGGEAAVSSSVYDSLSAILGGWCHVDRVSGADRQATALAIYNYGVQWAKDNKVEGWGSTAIIATGMNYADALSASSYAFATKSPIFLADSEGALSADIKAALSKGFSGAIVLGGEARVSAATYSELQTQFGEDNVSRFSGDDRYATSASFAKWAVDKGVLAYQGAAITTGKNFPDALAGAPVLGLDGSVLLLVDEDGTAALDGLFGAKDGLTSIRYFGGENAVSQNLRDYVESNLGWN